MFISIILLFKDPEPSWYTGVLWKTKLKEIPPNIKIITHYKQITILNVIFVIMRSPGRIRSNMSLELNKTLGIQFSNAPGLRL